MVVENDRQTIDNLPSLTDSSINQNNLFRLREVQRPAIPEN